MKLLEDAKRHEEELRYVDAIRCYQKIIDGYNSSFLSFFYRNDYPQAIQSRDRIFNQDNLWPPFIEEIGHLYFDGKEVKQNDIEALKWFEKASKLSFGTGTAEATKMIGVFYEQGRGGLEKDEGQAIYYYLKAIQCGSTDAENNMRLLIPKFDELKESIKSSLSDPENEMIVLAIAASKFNPSNMQTYKSLCGIIEDLARRPGTHL